MKKHILITKCLSILVFLIFLSSLNVNTAYAQSSAITNGLSWLETQSNLDGSLGNITSTTDITRTTVAVMDTLVADRRAGSRNRQIYRTWKWGDTYHDLY
ncbi:MAG: hypothetical protein M1381_09835 [Deltaproteobacteria bacterium]|nr:hypothetical protein [Deltaproteobacteria bacterium]